MKTLYVVKTFNGGYLAMNSRFIFRTCSDKSEALKFSKYEALKLAKEFDGRIEKAE